MLLGIKHWTMRTGRKSTLKLMQFEMEIRDHSIFFSCTATKTQSIKSYVLVVEAVHQSLQQALLQSLHS